VLPIPRPPRKYPVDPEAYDSESRIQEITEEVQKLEDLPPE